MFVLRRFLLFFIFVGLIYFLFTPLLSQRRVKLAHKQSILLDEVISFNEMKSFLEVWSQYCEKGYPKTISSGVSIYNGKLEDVIPKNIYIWLKRRGWTVTRFYYIEQRLRSVVKAAVLEAHKRANREMLKKGNLRSEDYNNLGRIISEQNKKMTIGEVTPEEVAMVSESLSQIDDILNCNVLYQP